MKWIKEKKKKIIVAVIVAGLGAAVPALPPSITAPVIEIIYSIFENSSEVLP